MPNFPIVDTHVHLWDPTRFRMYWLDDSPSINRPYLPHDFHQHSDACNIEAYVYVEVDVAPAYALMEARWVSRLEDPKLRGIVAHAPLHYGEQVHAYLEALKATDPRVKGVRRLMQAEPDENFCLQPAFVAGVKLLTHFDLSFDICIRSEQLPAVIELVARCPDAQFILDHVGKAEIARREMEPWRERIAELASLPNVVCKVSGMVTEADHAAWTAADLAPYVEHVVASFGEDRVMFGGDWPVALLASSYSRWVETLDALTRGLSESARRKLWRDNAMKVYRL